MKDSGPKMTFSRLLPWVLRVAWAALPVTAGPSLEAALRSHSTPVALLAAHPQIMRQHYQLFPPVY